MSHRLYVESSAFLRVTLEEDAVLRRMFAAAPLVTSALTLIEASRAISRAQEDRRIAPEQAAERLRQLTEFEESCDVIPIHEAIVQRARGRFPAEPIRSLDAIHLATIQFLAAELGELDVATCDERVKANVLRLGLTIVPGP